MAKHDHSRREFLMTASIAAGSIATGLGAKQEGTSLPPISSRGVSSAQEVRRVVSASDLVLSGAVERSDEGVPVGNGRMGTLVWTTSRRLRMQINHVDLYTHGCRTNSFFEANNDYCCGCAFVDIVFDDEVFPSSGFRQHLSVYEGALTIEGKGVTIRVVPLMNDDVLAITISSGPGRTRAISANLRMLRYERKYVGPQTELLMERNAVRVQHLSHSATSRLSANNDRIALTQEFQEDDFLSRSCVAIGVTGAQPTAEIVNDTEVELQTKGSGERTFLVVSSVTYARNEDVAVSLLRKLDGILSQDITHMCAESQEWWAGFWLKGSIELHSEDGTADLVQRSYHYYLYLMAATSRGKYPPKFNSMLWSTDGDLRAWGAQHWFTNLSCYYDALPASGRFELMEPMFEMYTGMLPSCVRAAKQQWGAEGHYIPETVYFDGIEEMPEPIAAEMRELYLVRKSWDQRSAEFMEYAQTKHLYSSRWNWIAGSQWKQGRHILTERGSGPYGPTSHMFNINAKIAYIYWLRYEYTMDREWLQARAYPMLRGAVEFYRTFPNTIKGEDGKYHINWSNSGEPIFGARDTMEDTAAVYTVTAALLRAARILDVDRAMQATWQEFFDHLPAMPTSDHPDAIVAVNYKGPQIFVNALKPAVKADRTPNGWLPDPNSMSISYFDLCKMETAKTERLALAQATFDELAKRYLGEEPVVGGLSALPLTAASLGRADFVETLVPNQMRAFPAANSTAYKRGGLLANRLTSAEGTQGLSAQHLGRASEALQQALLQSNPPEPGGDPVLHLFPAWPKAWDARYTLRARGGFIVFASIRSGVIEEIIIESLAGKACTMRNPFGERDIQLIRNKSVSETLHGHVVTFPTVSGERIQITMK